MSPRSNDEWSDIACGLPGAPESWEAIQHWSAKNDGDRRITGDGAWWRPSADGTRWVLDVTAPATEGVLLRLLGRDLRRVTVMGGSFGVQQTRDGLLFAEAGVVAVTAAQQAGRWAGKLP